MLRKNWISITLLLTAAVFLIVGCAAPPAQIPRNDKVLRLGLVVPLSGPAAQWGKEAEPLQAIYAEIVNGNGGIKVGDDNYTLEFYQADGPMWPPSVDVASCRTLVYDKKVDAIVVYYGISNAPMAAITNSAKVIFNQSNIYGGYYNPKQHPYCVFGYPTLELSNAQPLAAAKALGATTIAIVGIKSGNEALEGKFESFDRQYQEKYGIKVVRHYWSADTTDYSPFLTKMKAQNVQLIYTMENLTIIGMMRKQAYQMGFKVPIAMSSTIIDVNLLKGLVGSTEALENICGDYSAPYVLQKAKIPERYLSMALEIKRRWVEKLHKEPNTGVMSVRTQMIGQYLEAVQRAGTKNPDAVMKIFREETLDTFLGTYKFSGKQRYGDNVVCGYPCGIGIIKSGQIQYLTEWPIQDIDTDAPIF